MATVSMRGRFVFPDGVRAAEISFDEKSGLISSVSILPHARGERFLIFPGFMDIHVHAREFPRPDGDTRRDLATWEALCRKETFASAGRAAINGGVTLFCAMPNDPYPPLDSRSYSLKKAVSEQSECPVILYGLISPGGSEPWDDLPYKVYLDAGSSPIAFSDWKSLEEALGRYRGHRVFFHAEDPDVLRRSAGPGHRWETRPAEAEILAVEKILELTVKLDLIGHICHVSTRGALERIIDFNSGAERKVTCEATPHHLFFSVMGGAVHAADWTRLPRPQLLECNPPLRSEEDRLFLLDALLEGRVDVLATDHAPHTIRDKEDGAPGMPHLDTVGPFVGWLMNSCSFPAVRIAEILATRPGEIFAGDIHPRQGRLEPGQAASFTVLDLEGRSTVGEGEIAGRGALETRCGWSPFEGVTLPARIAGTVVRGKQHHF